MMMYESFPYFEKILYKNYKMFYIINEVLLTVKKINEVLPAKVMNINKLVCYSNFLHCVNLIKGLQVRYDIRTVLI
jgi:hypothetical protein